MDFVTNPVFGLRQARISLPSELLLDALELVGASEPRIGGDIVDRLGAQELSDLHVIAKRYFFEPIHHIAQVILADFKV